MQQQNDSLVNGYQVTGCSIELPCTSRAQFCDFAAAETGQTPHCTPCSTCDTSATSPCGRCGLTLAGAAECMEVTEDPQQIARRHLF